MTDGTEQRPESGGKESFSRVLDGEAAADARLTETRREAERICRSALAEERRVSSRADRRLQALYGATNAMIDRERGRMADAFEADRREMSAPIDEDRIAGAAMRLARRLVGLDPS